MPGTGHSQQPELRMTRQELQALMEETAARAATEAVKNFVESPSYMSTENPNPSTESTVPLSRERRTTHDEEDSRATSAPVEEFKPVTRTAGHGSRTMNGEESSLAGLPGRRSPFTEIILSETLHRGIKLSNLPEFDGTSDPQDHIDKFYAKADLYDISDAAYCKIFRTTLTGRALKWFNKLPTGSIASLEQLTKRFGDQFSINKKYEKTAAYLFKVVQKEGETLREYVKRFMHAVHEVPDVNHDLLAGIMQQNLHHRKFKESIAGKPPKDLDELLRRAEKHIRVEEALEPHYPMKRKRDDDRADRPERKEKRVAQNRRSPNLRLNAQLVDILVVAERQGLLQLPRPMRESAKRQQSDKYCRFHKDRGHSTENCFSLRTEIEKLIKQGYLENFVDKSRDQRRDGRGSEVKPPADADENLPTGGVIAVISGGPTCENSTKARYSLAQAVRGEKITLGRPPCDVSSTAE